MAGQQSSGGTTPGCEAGTEVPGHRSVGSPYFTRSQVECGYKAAGVLPFAILESCGRLAPFVLLGGEPTRTGPKGCVRRTMWGDFGGHREAIDEGCPISTASREFAEETLGIFASTLVNMQSVEESQRSMAKCLSSDTAFHVTHKLRRGEYRMYVAQTSFVDPMFFHLAAETNLVTGAIAGGEKTSFAWVALSDLLAAVGEARKVYFLARDARQRAIEGAVYPGAMQLHPCFATTMRLAMASGLAELVTSAQQVAASASVPPCMPPPGGRCLAGTKRKSAAPHPVKPASCRSSCEVSPQPPSPKHLLYWVSQDGVRSELLTAK